MHIERATLCQNMSAYHGTQTENTGTMARTPVIGGHAGQTGTARPTPSHTARPE